MLITLPNKSANVWFTVASKMYLSELFYVPEKHTLILCSTLLIDKTKVIRHWEWVGLNTSLFWYYPRKVESTDASSPHQPI